MSSNLRHDLPRMIGYRFIVCQRWVGSQKLQLGFGIKNSQLD